MKNISFLVMLFALKLLAQSSEIIWEKNIGGSKGDVGNSLEIEISGSVIAGWTASMDHDLDQNYGATDGLVTYLDHSGNIVWVHNFGGSEGDFFYDIARTNDQGYIVVGETFSNDGDIATYYGNGDGWILKLDQNGNIEWEKTIGTGLEEEIRNVIATPLWKYYISGSTTENETTINWIMRLDALGNTEWIQYFDENYIDDMQLLIDGGFILAGTNPTGETWAMRLDNMGNIVWQQNFPDINDQGMFHLYSITETSDGGFITAGFFFGFFPPSGFGSGDIKVLKLDSLGNILWEEDLGGSGAEWAYDILESSEGGYLVVGKTTSNDGHISNNNGIMDFLIAYLNSSGTIQWVKTLGGSHNDMGYGIRETADGDIIVVGETYSNDGDISNFYGNDFYLPDMWVVKLNANLGISSSAEPEKIKVYPNPVKTTFVIETPGNMNLEFIFRDIGGRQIHIPRTTIKNSFNATSLPPGIYFATVKSADFPETVRIVKLE